MKKLLGILIITVAIFAAIHPIRAKANLRIRVVDLDSCIANAGAYYDQQNDDCLWASQQDPNFNLPACFGSVEQQFSQDLGTCYRIYGFVVAQVRHN